MQLTSLSSSALHEFYTHAVLPQFGIRGEYVRWRNISPPLILSSDGEAHFVSIGGERYVLLFQDYPTLDFREIKFAICQTNDEDIRPIPLTDQDKDSTILRFGPSALPFRYVHNVTGYFSLYRVVLTRKAKKAQRN